MKLRFLFCKTNLSFILKLEWFDYNIQIDSKQEKQTSKSDGYN